MRLLQRALVLRRFASDSAGAGARGARAAAAPQEQGARAAARKVARPRPDATKTPQQQPAAATLSPRGALAEAQQQRQQSPPQEPSMVESPSAFDLQSADGEEDLRNIMNPNVVSSPTTGHDDAEYEGRGEYQAGSEASLPQGEQLKLLNLLEGPSLGIFQPLKDARVPDWNAVMDDLFEKKTAADVVQSPLKKLNISKSSVAPAQQTPWEVIKEHSDFSDVASLATKESSKFMLNVVAPRLGRLPRVSPKDKRELLTKLAKTMNQ